MGAPACGGGPAWPLWTVHTRERIIMPNIIRTNGKGRYRGRHEAKGHAAVLMLACALMLFVIAGAVVAGVNAQ